VLWTSDVDCWIFEEQRYWGFY